MGRAMLVMRRLQHVVSNPDDPLCYGVIFFRSHDVDSTTWVVVESRRLRTTTDASPSLAASAGALRQATLDTTPPFVGNDQQGQLGGERSLWKTVCWAGRISASAPFS